MCTQLIGLVYLHLDLFNLDIIFQKDKSLTPCQLMYKVCTEPFQEGKRKIKAPVPSDRWKVKRKGKKSLKSEVKVKSINTCNIFPFETDF